MTVEEMMAKIRIKIDVRYATAKKTLGEIRRLHDALFPLPLEESAGDQSSPVGDSVTDLRPFSRHVVEPASHI